LVGKLVLNKKIMDMNSTSNLREQIVNIFNANPATSRETNIPEKNINHLDRLKSLIHREILNEMDLRKMERLPADKVKDELKVLTENLIGVKKLALNQNEMRMLVDGIQNEILGLGPIQPLLGDSTVSDILVNGPYQVYVERFGQIESSDIVFEDSSHLMRVIERIVSRVGRRIDEMSPMVDARLPDGSRVNAVIPPLAIDGPQLSIRRFSVSPYTMSDLLKFQTLTEEMGQLISGLVKAKVNLLISGGTGSGKTTFLNVISANIPGNERIVTIEDAAELQLQQRHVVRMEARPPNIEGKGEVPPRALLRNSLRMRPDRIIMGEVRGGEVLDMLQAMNTGHEGSMTTIHANSPRDAMTRLEHMISMTGIRTEVKTMRQQIAAALSVIIQVSRLSDGRRKVTSVQEITGVEGDVISMQEIFRFEQTGTTPEGAVLGNFVVTGIRPKILERLKSRGVDFGSDFFNPN
jgi:pilus assembly protein CpaF